MEETWFRVREASTDVTSWLQHSVKENWILLWKMAPASPAEPPADRPRQVLMRPLTSCSATVQKTYIVYFLSRLNYGPKSNQAVVLMWWGTGLYCNMGHSNQACWRFVAVHGADIRSELFSLGFSFSQGKHLNSVFICCMSGHYWIIVTLTCYKQLNIW